MWDSERSAELYGIADWGQGFFRVDADGRVVARPRRDREPELVLPELIDELRGRGVDTPVLIRFADVAKDRVVELQESFEQAIRESEYQGRYRCIYPVKVNVQRPVVEAMLAAGKGPGVGLETGSKAELLTALGLLDADRLIICNGYKDLEYLELALYGNRVGFKVIPVIEKLSEVPVLTGLCERHAFDIDFGIRVQLASRGAGRWEKSGGDRAKFGLTASEILQTVGVLKAAGKLGRLKLLHFHIGSQICHSLSLRAAVREAAYVYVELRRLGADLTMIDVGGGLAVDYDGSRSASSQSTDYSWLEYASTIVCEVGTICDEAGEPHPALLSESGRALSAHHSVLVTNVLGARSRTNEEPVPAVESDAPPQLRALHEIVETFDGTRLQETVHEIRDLGEQVQDLFRLGCLSLRWRALGESLYWQALRRVHAASESLTEAPDELERLDELLSAIYYCNLSIFQSLPDAWAIDQVFPIMPIQGLNEEPDRRAVLADITCDSDGKIDRFVTDAGIVNALPVHALPADASPYRLGIFLVGAYQEILGDLHNLFGDPHVAHVVWDERTGGYAIDHVEYGDTVDEVLSYVQYGRDDLIAHFRRRVEECVEAGDVPVEQAQGILATYQAGFSGYTYFEDALE